ncbi:MAG: hypothetical protein ACO1RA_16095 [Planctomycetaceae bacterium]
MAIKVPAELLALQKELEGKIEGMVLVTNEGEPCLLLENEDRAAEVAFVDGSYWIEMSDDLEDEEALPPGDEQADSLAEAAQIVLDWLCG